MKSILIYLAMLLGMSAAASEHNVLSPAETAEGWRLLFDGQTTEGWRNYRSRSISDGWQVVDGTLARVAAGARDLVTIEQFGDFELAFEALVETGGNSGVFFRADETQRFIFMSAPEIQVLDDANHRDGKNPLTSAGSNYALHPAPRGLAHPAGEWNSFRVRVQGNHVVHWLNGQEIVNYQLGSADWMERVAASKFADWPIYGTLERGYIGLQDHGDPVKFRNIKIRVLDGDSSTVIAAETFAERLGWPQGTRALILHVDDAGMSHDSNLGAVRAIEEGVANSLSVMMPTPWVPEIVRWISTDANHDAGLHLTLTAEWQDYRWGPVSGSSTPGLIDGEGALWTTVAEVVTNASADEVEAEIRAQLARARKMGFEPTHLDSHMGTLFASDAFLERYFKVGIEEQIPVMFPGGHGYFIGRQQPERAAQVRGAGEQLWAAGLPVLDDLHNLSYGWARQDKVANYIAAIEEMRPGVMMMIMHCTDTTEGFPHISDSGETRQGDLEAMLDPRFREAIEREGIVLTTWRELMQRRQSVR